METNGLQRCLEKWIQQLSPRDHFMYLSWFSIDKWLWHPRFKPRTCNQNINWIQSHYCHGANIDLILLLLNQLQIWQQVSGKGAKVLQPSVHLQQNTAQINGEIISEHRYSVNTWLVNMKWRSNAMVWLILNIYCSYGILRKKLLEIINNH